MDTFELKQDQAKLIQAALKQAMLLNNFCRLSFNFRLQFERVESNVNPVHVASRRGYLRAREWNDDFNEQQEKLAEYWTPNLVNSGISDDDNYNMV